MLNLWYNFRRNSSEKSGNICSTSGINGVVLMRIFWGIRGEVSVVNPGYICGEFTEELLGGFSDRKP